jgi:hypothetical protein
LIPIDENRNPLQFFRFAASAARLHGGGLSGLCRAFRALLDSGPRPDRGDARQENPLQSADADPPRRGR